MTQFIVAHLVDAWEIRPLKTVRSKKKDMTVKSNPWTRLRKL